MTKHLLNNLSSILINILHNYPILEVKEDTTRESYTIKGIKGFCIQYIPKGFDIIIICIMFRCIITGNNSFMRFKRFMRL